MSRLRRGRRAELQVDNEKKYCILLAYSVELGTKKKKYVDRWQAERRKTGGGGLCIQKE